MIKELRKKYGSQFVRFFIVGVGATIIHWGSYVLLNLLFSISEEQAIALSCTYAAGYIISFIANYLLSLKWTFKTKGSVGKSVGFAFSHLINFTMHLGLLNIFMFMGVGELMVKCIQFCTPWLTTLLPTLGNPSTLLPLPVFIIVVPINFLLVRFFLTRGDQA